MSDQDKKQDKGGAGKLPVCMCGKIATHEIIPGSLEDYYTGTPRHLCRPCHAAFKLGQAWSGVRTEEL